MMRDLDAAEAEASGGSERPTLPPDEVRRYLESLPAWWADADPDDRRALATTLFERIRVLGVSVAKLEPTQEARDHGLAEAFGPDDVEMVGARGFEPPTSSSRTMRATKLRHAPTEVLVTQSLRMIARDHPGRQPRGDGPGAQAHSTGRSPPES
jgi:hypothetical protein